MDKQSALVVARDLTNLAESMASVAHIAPPSLRATAERIRAVAWNLRGGIKQDVVKAVSDAREALRLIIVQQNAGKLWMSRRATVAILTAATDLEKVA